MLRSAYLKSKLSKPLPVKDVGLLRTIADAVGYMTALPPHRECHQRWQRACELILDEADVAEVSRQLELALFYDAKLILT